MVCKLPTFVHPHRLRRQSEIRQLLGARRDAQIRYLAKYVDHVGVSLFDGFIQCAVDEFQPKLRNCGRDVQVLVYDLTALIGGSQKAILSIRASGSLCCDGSGRALRFGAGNQDHRHSDIVSRSSPRSMERPGAAAEIPCPSIIHI